MAGAFEKIEQDLVDELALLVLEGGMVPAYQRTDYKAGWLDGYSRVWTKLTGKNWVVLFDRVNDALKGSGKEPLQR